MRKSGRVSDGEKVPGHAKTARQRAREQITAEIIAAARARLRDEGPAQLSLRAVARDVGMVSSAVYRYVTSRDDLLTLLLIEAYNELGAVAEQADAEVDDRADTAARWMAVCRAIRCWALEHPGDYGLLYGTPVPGYAAPRTTIEPATRATVVLVRIVADAYRVDPSRAPAPPARGEGTSEASVAEASSISSAHEYLAQAGLGDAFPDGSDGVMRLLMAWSSIFGTLSFEMFGHFVGSVDDSAAYFDQAMRRLAIDLGVADAEDSGRSPHASGRRNLPV